MTQTQTQTQEQNVPALRFPEFSGEWTKVRLGQFFEEYKKKTVIPNQHEVLTSGRKGLVLQRDYYENGRISERDNVGFNVIPPNYITYRSRSDDRLFFFNENTLGITGAISIYYPVFRIREGNNKFFISLLSKNARYVGKYSVGTSQTVLSMNELKLIRLPLPKPSEQQKIASFLSSVDSKIEQLSKKKALLGQYKKGMMQKLFSQELRFAAQGSANVTGAGVAGATKDSEGDSFPDWKEKRLGDVCEVNPKASGLPQEFIYIDLESVVSGSLVKRTNIKKLEAPSRAQRLLKKEDVLFQMVRPYQKNNYYFDKVGDYVASTGYAQLRAKESAMFLYHFLHADLFVNKVLVRCTGTSYPAINSNDLAKIHFAFPTCAEQQKIADFLSSIDQKIDLVAAELEHAKSFKKGLLQQMFI